MANKGCVTRLQKEFRAICKEPPPQIVARPSSSDILDWHFVIEGSPGTPFEGGYYYGKLKFPPEYPYKPPSITILFSLTICSVSMLTPNGRFAPHKKICLSMSDFHPETWNPMWSVSSILTGLLSFMLDDHQTTGSIRTTDDERRKLAKLTLAYNCESKNCPNFKKLFPEYFEIYRQQQPSVQSTLQQNVQDKLSSTSIEQNARQSENQKAVNKVVKTRQGSTPFWLIFLLISFFGVVMALPLLQL